MSKEKIPMENPKKPIITDSLEVAEEAAIEESDRQIKGLLPEHKSPKIDSKELKNLLSGGRNWKDSVPIKKTESKQSEEKTETNIMSTDAEFDGKIRGIKKRKPKEQKEEMVESRKEKNEKTKNKNLEELKLKEGAEQEQKQESRIEKLEKLSFKELSDKISVRVNELEGRIQRAEKGKEEEVSKEELEEKLQEFSEMRDVAEKFLANKENFISYLSKEEIEKNCKKLENSVEEVNMFLEKFGKKENLKELNYPELTAKINEYIAKAEEKINTTNRKKARKELEKIKELGNIAGYFLGKAELFAETRKISDEEMISFCVDLKDARNKLRKLYVKIADKAGIRKKESLPKSEKEAPLVEDILADWLEEEPVEYNFPKEGKEKVVKDKVKDEVEILDKTIKKLAEKEKELNEKYKLEIEQTNKARIYSELENVKKSLDYYQEKREQTEDAKRMEAKQKEEKRIEEILESLPHKTPEKKEEEKAMKSEKKERTFGGAFEGFTSGENVAEKTNLIQEKIKQKEQELKETKQRLKDYRAGVIWPRREPIRDFNWYVDAGNLKIIKKELKELKKQEKREAKENKRRKKEAKVFTPADKTFEEVVVIPKKKRGFFSRIFGRKTGEAKKPKILTEKQLLKSVGKISKKRLREIIDEENKKGNS